MNKRAIRSFFIDLLLISILTITLFIVFRVSIFNPYFITYLIIASIVIFCNIFFTTRYCNKRNINIVLYQTRMKAICIVTILIMPIVPVVVASLQISVKTLSDFNKKNNSNYNNYNLKNDIDLTNEKLTCNDDHCYYLEKLDGNLIGNGYTFLNAKGAIFNKLNADAITDIIIEYNGVECYKNFGVLAITSNASINKVAVGGTINGTDYIGGLVYENTGTIILSSFNGQINGQDYIGGICAINKGEIVGCEVTGIISGRNDVAGMVSKIEGKLLNCYLNANIVGEKVGALSAYIGTYLDYDKLTGKKDLESPSDVSASICFGSLRGNELVGELVSKHIGVTYVNMNIDEVINIPNELDSRIYVPSYDTITIYAAKNRIVSNEQLKVVNKLDNWYIKTLGLDIDYWIINDTIDADNSPKLQNVKKI